MDIKVSGLKKQYRTGDRVQLVLDGIDFEVKSGEICTIFGPSGSGKSTLLNLIGGLEVADAGQIYAGDTEITKLKGKKLMDYRRKTLGFIFQFYNLVADLTVRENIEIGSYISDHPMDEEELIEALGMTANADKFPRQISGGEQQRTAIGRAIIKNPDILLCDEPTGALDYSTAKEILGLIQEINGKYNTTILMVTHNEAIKDMSDRIIRLHDGRIVENLENDKKLAAKELTW